MNRDWVNEQGHRTKKTPTSLLLKPDLSFHSFGYKAEEKYCNLKNVYEEKEYWFFQHFKMCLHNDEVSVLETVTLFQTHTHTQKKTNKRKTNKQTKAHTRTLGEKARKETNNYFTHISGTNADSKTIH